MMAIVNNPIETAPGGAIAYVLVSTTQGDIATPTTATPVAGYHLTITAGGGGRTHAKAVTLNVN